VNADADDLELRDLNLGIGRAEKAHDLDFLRDVLHDDLVFRRADGSFVDKDAYLADLPNRVYEEMETQVTEVDAKTESAVVTAIVTTRGMSRGTPFAGTFRNTRAFARDGTRWRCKLWINTRLPG